MKKIFRLLLLFLLPFVLASCGDKKESAQSCSIQLDEQKYSKVSENENCTNYERASAYLGRAGMSASNFLKTGATDNLTKTLGIKKLSPDDPTSAPTDYETGNRGYVTKALCLIGADTFTGSSSRCPGASPRTGSSGEVEISMLANIADFIYLNYGVLDNDSNGTLADTEVEGFTKLQTDGISVAGLGTGLVPYDRFEVVAGSDHYIATSNLGACVAYNDNYTVDPSNGGGTCAALQLAGSVTELRPIFKLDNMTDITSGGTLNTLVSMVSELSMISSALSSDFDSIGISSENSIRKTLSLGLSKLDNGAKGIIQANEVCAAVTVFDVMFLLVKNAADNSTTSSGLKSANLISTADLINAVDTSLKDKLLPSGASQALKNLPMQSARIVYATNSPGTTYTDSYEKAESSLYEAMKNTRSLGTDDSVKGDGKVTFRELICVAEN